MKLKRRKVRWVSKSKENKEKNTKNKKKWFIKR
jgi:hypothetical protein